MNNTQNKTGGLQQTLSRFAAMVSGIGAIFLAPYVAQNFRTPMYEYLLTGFDYSIAYWSSWGFVALVVAGTYFGGSVLLQLFIHGLLRLATTRGSF